MVVYLSLAAFELVLYALYLQFKNEKARKWLFFIGCLAIVLIVGLRSERTGNDTIGYVRNFSSINLISWKGLVTEYPKDTGFYFFVKLIRMVTDSKVIFLLATAFMSLFGIFDLIKRNSKSPVLALFFYVTLSNFNFIMTGIRQSIAMSFCMLSVRYVQERKFFRFLLLVLIAAQFHHSAYIFLVMYFLGTRKINALNILISILVTVAAYFSYEKLLDVANELLNYDYGVEYLDNGMIFFVILLCILTICLLTKDKWITSVKETVMMNSGIMCGIIWVFRLVGRTAERPSMYWLNTIPVILPEALDSIEQNQTRKLIKLFAIVLSLAFFAYRSLSVSYAFCF